MTARRGVTSDGSRYDLLGWDVWTYYAVQG